MNYLKTAKMDYQFYSHDSLHTMSHMMKELLFFKKCNLDRFLIFIDDQNSENFWAKCIDSNAFNKSGYDVKFIAGGDCTIPDHLGGLILYERK